MFNFRRTSHPTSGSIVILSPPDPREESQKVPPVLAVDAKPPGEVFGPHPRRRETEKAVRPACWRWRELSLVTMKKEGPSVMAGAWGGAWSGGLWPLGERPGGGQVKAGGPGSWVST